MLVSDGHEDVCAGCLSGEGGAVSAVVGADDREVRRRALPFERANRLSDAILLVVSVDQGDD
jgi:hypothetical protein